MLPKLNIRFFPFVKENLDSQKTPGGSQPKEKRRGFGKNAEKNKKNQGENFAKNKTKKNRPEFFIFLIFIFHLIKFGFFILSIYFCATYVKKSAWSFFFFWKS